MFKSTKTNRRTDGDMTASKQRVLRRTQEDDGLEGRTEARERLYKLVAGMDITVARLERDELERGTEEQPGRHHRVQTIQHRCTNWLRHYATKYDAFLSRITQWPSNDVEREVLQQEKRSCVAILKRRVLDKIAEVYPFLTEECERQKHRAGVESEPGEFVLPLPPFRA